MTILSTITSSLAIKLAIDLGTVTTLVYEEGRGLIVNEPTIIALEKHTNKVVAVGNEALEMLGRAPRNVVHIRPLKDGAIADFDAAEKMLRTLIGRAVRGRIFRPLHVAIAVPNQSTPVERRAVRDSLRKARARNVIMIEEGIAVGWGVGLPVAEPHASMVIDIGGGTTNITVCASSGIVCSRTLTVAGNRLDEAITSYMKRERSLLISERSAEEIKVKLGSVMPLEEELRLQVVGKGTTDCVPREITVTSEEIRPVIQDTISYIADQVIGVLDFITPQTLGDIFQRGIMITGGTANIRKLDKYLEQHFQIKVHTVPDSFLSVVTGLSQIMPDSTLMEKVRLKERTIDWRASEALTVGTPY